MCAGCASSLVACPLEQIKARLQVQYSDPKSKTYSGPVDCFMKLFETMVSLDCTRGFLVTFYLFLFLFLFDLLSLVLDPFPPSVFCSKLFTFYIYMSITETIMQERYSFEPSLWFISPPMRSIERNYLRCEFRQTWPFSSLGVCCLGSFFFFFFSKKKKK